MFLPLRGAGEKIHTDVVTLVVETHVHTTPGLGSASYIRYGMESRIETLQL
eukprot:TRINITY_DN5553_c0_g1_i1.p3 TRINITY_DN5553_c0_g1~~TRINITY_DN5553_c0_g1_i1.p3  ORF type:complete len:51 (+),score=5.46 TRINITY_DN5553_c0_g1_i1:624-776(+)